MRKLLTVGEDDRGCITRINKGYSISQIDARMQESDGPTNLSSARCINFMVSFDDSP